MRIAFLLTQDLESPSGIGRYWPLAQELSRLGHSVVILALHANYAALSIEERTFEKAGVEVRYVAQMHVRKIGNQKQYFNPLRLLWVVLQGTGALLWAALQVRADIYHIGKPHPMNGIAGLLASVGQRRSLYLDCDDYEAVSNRVSGRLQRAGLVLFEKLLPKLVKGITTNTHFTWERLKASGIPGEKIVYVPNGVDRSRFSVTRQRHDGLREHFGAVDKKVILYVGSMSLTSHPVDLLLNAFKIVRRYEARAFLLLVGGGEDYEQLRQLAYGEVWEKDVHFAGRVKPELIPLYYQLADVSVDPVLDDMIARARYPLKVVESLACGIPVVTGDVGDRRELLEGGKLGVLVSPGDSSTLADGLLSVLQDAGTRTRMSQAALENREQWWWDRLVHRFLRVYEEAA